MGALRIGLISDTHGLLRPQALQALGSCDHLIHAGDIGELAVLDALASLAPLSVVRGNNDRDEVFARVPETVCLELGGRRILVVHDLRQPEFKSAVAFSAPDVVISGHSHRPMVERREGVLYVNPGSAGPRRFQLPVTIAHLLLSERGVEAQITELAL